MFSRMVNNQNLMFVAIIAGIYAIGLPKKTMQGISETSQDAIRAVVAPKHHNSIFSSPENDAHALTENEFFDLSSNDTPLSFTEFECNEMRNYCQNLMELCQSGRPRPDSILSVYIKLNEFDGEALQLVADDLVLASLWCIHKFRHDHIIIARALDMLTIVYPGSSTESKTAVLLIKLALLALSLHKDDDDILDIGVRLTHYIVATYGYEETIFLAFCEEGGVETLRSLWKEFLFQEAADALNIIRAIAAVNHKRFGSDKTSYTHPLYVHTRLVLLRLPKDFR